MKSIRFIAEAEQDFESILTFYFDTKPEIIPRIEADLAETLDLIAIQPETWAIASAQTRKLQMSHHPYTIFYRIYPDHIAVVAVMHQKRHPNSWRTR